MYFFFRYIFCYYLPLKKDDREALHLNQLESASPVDALCQVWLKLVPWFQRRIFKNFINVVFAIFVIYLPSKKGAALHLNQLDSASPQDALFQVWLKLAPYFWRKFFNFLKYFHYFVIIPLGKGGVIQILFTK